jgi:hypothetical protein
METLTSLSLLNNSTNLKLVVYLYIIYILILYVIYMVLQKKKKLCIYFLVRLTMRSA